VVVRSKSPSSIPTRVVLKSLPSRYRRRIIELVRAGRSFNELAREFEPSTQCYSQVA